MKVFWFFLVLFSVTLAYSQSYNIGSLLTNIDKNGKIKGVVLDNETNNQSLLFAEVTIKNSNYTTTTNLNGVFSFKIKPGTYTLVFSFIGYKTIEVKNIIVTANKTTEHSQTLLALNFEADISSLN